MVGLVLQRLLMAGDGLLQVARSPERRAEVIVRQGRARISGDRGAQLDDRPL